MAEIINLRQARKRKQRAAEQRKASENRALHGSDKATTKRREQDRHTLDRTLDGAKVEADPPDTPDPAS